MSAKVMQKLAQHSTVELTIGRYTHAELHDLSAAVGRLVLPSPAARRSRAAGNAGDRD